MWYPLLGGALTQGIQKKMGTTFGLQGSELKISPENEEWISSCLYTLRLKGLEFIVFIFKGLRVQSLEFIVYRVLGFRVEAFE